MEFTETARMSGLITPTKIGHPGGSGPNDSFGMGTERRSRMKILTDRVHADSTRYPSHTKGQSEHRCVLSFLLPFLGVWMFAQFVLGLARAPGIG